jgi:hypothetical protein
MTVSAHASGTQTCTVTTEHEVDSVNSAGTFTFHVDLDDMVAGDVVELRVYQMILTGGTAKVAYFQRFSGVQPTDDMIKVSVPVSNHLTDTDSLRFTIKQTHGTSIDAPWTVIEYN